MDSSWLGKTRVFITKISVGKYLYYMWTVQPRISQVYASLESDQERTTTQGSLKWSEDSEHVVTDQTSGIIFIKHIKLVCSFEVMDFFYLL